MATDRIKRVRSDFNHIHKDKRASMKARGLLSTIMSLPDTWKFTMRGLIAILPDGRDSVYRTVDELRELGYCVRKRRPRKEGQFSGYTYVFHESPVGSSPHPEKPDTVKPTEYNTKNNNHSVVPQSYIQVGDTYVGQSDDFFANLEEVGPNDNPEPQFLLDVSPEEVEKGPPIPDSAFHHMYRICYNAGTVDEQKFLDSKMRGRVASTLGKLRDADADFNQLIIFENWWRNSWMSGQRNGSYTPPRPEQVLEFWLVATAGKKGPAPSPQPTAPTLDEMRTIMQWRPPND